MQRQPDLSFGGGETEGCGHYADNLAVHAFKFDRAANDGFVAAEAFFPKCVGQDNEVVLASEVFAGIKRAAEFGAHLKNREQLRRYHRGGQTNWVALPSQVELMTLTVAADVHRVNLLAHCGERPRRVSRSHAHQLFGLRIWQWAKKNSIDQAEDGSVGSDSERNR